MSAQGTVYGVIVTSKEARSGALGNPVVTHAGERFWATVEPDGWVEASSLRVSDSGAVPGDPLLFETPELAEAFAKRWKGHPWWCKPNGEFEIVPLRQKFTQCADGYERATEAARAVLGEAL